MPRKEKSWKGKGRLQPPSFELRRKANKKKKKERFAYKSPTESDWSDSEKDQIQNEMSDEDDQDGSAFATPQGLLYYLHCYFLCIL